LSAEPAIAADIPSPNQPRELDAVWNDIDRYRVRKAMCDHWPCASKTLGKQDVPLFAIIDVLIDVITTLPIRSTTECC